MQSALLAQPLQTLSALLRTTVMRHPTALLLAGCAAGLSCSLLAAPVALPPAQAGILLAQTSTEKASPFAGAKDETSSLQSTEQSTEPAAPAAEPEQAVQPASGEMDGTPKELAGTKAVGTKKNSPFAGAKESDEAAHADLRADRTRLWWLLLPVGLAAISYGALRSREGEGEL